MGLFSTDHNLVGAKKFYFDIAVYSLQWFVLLLWINKLKLKLINLNNQKIYKVFKPQKYKLRYYNAISLRRFLTHSLTDGPFLPGLHLKEKPSLHGEGKQTKLEAAGWFTFINKCHSWEHHRLAQSLPVLRLRSCAQATNVLTARFMAAPSSAKTQNPLGWKLLWSEHMSRNVSPRISS